MSNKSPEQRRYDHEKTLHHRRPKSIGGSGDKKNLSWIPRQRHEAWHTLFKNHTAEVICFMINQSYLDPSFEFICRRKE